MFNYRIYAKLPNDKYFYALGGEGLTRKLIYASHWPTLEKVTEVKNAISEANPEIQFKIFDVKQDKYI